MKHLVKAIALCALAGAFALSATDPSFAKRRAGYHAYAQAHTAGGYPPRAYARSARPKYFRDPQTRMCPPDQTGRPDWWSC